MADHCFLCNVEFVPTIDASHGFCNACVTKARASIANITSGKVGCYRCHEQFSITTIKKYMGFCNKCYKTSMIDTSDEDIPYRKERISAALRAMVWKQYGSSTYLEAKCWCCNTATIDALDFDCGHIVAESKGGETKLDNLRPVCRLCNVSMGTMNMMDFMSSRGFEVKDWSAKCSDSQMTELLAIIEAMQIDRPKKEKKCIIM